MAESGPASSIVTSLSVDRTSSDPEKGAAAVAPAGAVVTPAGAVITPAGVGITPLFIELED